MKVLEYIKQSYGVKPSIPHAIALAYVEKICYRHDPFSAPDALLRPDINNSRSEVSFNALGKKLETPGTHSLTRNAFISG